MNTPDPYERRIDRSLDEAPRQRTQPDQTTLNLATEQAAEPSALAVHRDPSQPPLAAAAGADRSKPSIAWVRPTDMPTVIGTAWVRRGIDLQAELTRRARRSPIIVTAHARGRISRTAIARPKPVTPTTTTREGLEL